MIIVSFTTLPERLDGIMPVLNSILAQTMQPDIIQVNLPTTYIRSGKKISNIPAFLSHEKIRVNRCEDMGPATKLIPTLYSGYSTDDIIITIDDDVIYEKGMIKALYDASLKFPDSALCMRGRKIIKGKGYNNSEQFWCNRTKTYHDVDIMLGTWGALCKRRFFTDDILEEQKNGTLFLTDDILISGHIAKNGVNRKAIPYPHPMLPQANHSVNSLWEMNKNGHNNNNSIKIYEKYW